ncbi:integrase [Gossypium australe]|uniref:Integrase n=1 Tax=Gossypium australe TaxID=47621 RepID=A0A5B6WRR5_9ROSI|nr:integrase [Gossypium australe]
MLIHPESGMDYMVYSDASYTSIGCVLMQDGKNHPDKANVVENALSRRSMTNLRKMFARLSPVDDKAYWQSCKSSPPWLVRSRKSNLWMFSCFLW